METVPTSITFSVDPVEPATEPLRECRAIDGLVNLAGRSAIACSNYSGMVVAGVKYNALVYAVHLAYADHRPLVLSPDMIWLAVAQGITFHILQHAEELRDEFVTHDGNAEVAVDLQRGFLVDSPYADWESVIRAFGNRVLAQVRAPRRALMLAKFSTTGPTEHAAQVITMMDAFQRYFDYVARAICGIPRITLEGRPEDWERIVEKTSAFETIGLGWWNQHLDPVLAHFVRASRGDVDSDHWRSIYKTVRVYGGERMTGWIRTLVPYLLNPETRHIYRNDDLAGAEGIKLNEVPLGIASAPITVRGLGGERRRINLSGGFTGIVQAGEDGALRPAIGWAVHEQPKLRLILDEIESHHRITTSSSQEDFAREFPADLRELYDRFGSVTMGAGLLRRPIRIRPRSRWNTYTLVQFKHRRVMLRPRGLYHRLALWLSHGRAEQSADDSRRPRGRRSDSLPARLGERMEEATAMGEMLDLYCIVDLPDGSHVGFCSAATPTRGSGQWRYIRFRAGVQRRKALQVVALSVEELLEGLITTRHPRFADHGRYEPWLETAEGLRTAEEPVRKHVRGQRSEGGGDALTEL